MNKNNLIIAAIFFAVGFVIAWQVWGGADKNSGNPNLADEETQVILETPSPEDTVNSPLQVSGTARGTWFFEASFPIEITDPDGTVLGQGLAEAQDDWMTEGFVPFQASINFNPGTNTEGWLVLKKDNPSGLPSLDDEIQIPINF